MSRLIDADKLKKTLLKFNYTTAHNQIFRYIDQQLTAFDKEKVIAELEEIKGKACTGKECISCVYNDICYEGEMSERVAIDNAIDIVKKGGVE